MVKIGNSDTPGVFGDAQNQPSLQLVTRRSLTVLAKRAGQTALSLLVISFLIQGLALSLFVSPTADAATQPTSGSQSAALADPAQPPRSLEDSPTPPPAPRIDQANGSTASDGKAATTNVQPATQPNLNLHFVNTYYANKKTDDTGTDTSTNCRNSVNTTCSLRSAIVNANADGHGTTPDLILLKAGIANAYQLGSTALPTVGSYITLSNSSTQSCPGGLLGVAYVNAGTLPATADILTLSSNDVISGIEVDKSKRDGIVITGSNNVLTCSTVFFSAVNGVSITTGAANNQIGLAGNGGTIGNIDFTSVKNGGSGILISGAGASGNVIKNAAIGYFPPVDAVYPNGVGITINSGATGNRVGSATNPQQYVNLIRNNTADGIDINGTDTNNNFVTGNYIGMDATGLVGQGNGGNQVRIDASATSTAIGGDRAAGFGNLIAGGNPGSSNVYVGGPNTLVQGNIIGVKVDFSGILNSGLNGVRVYIGGDNSQVVGNIIGGNPGSGIKIDIGNNVGIYGNYIGTDPTATRTNLGNATNGVFIGTGSSSNRVGGSGTGQGNVIAYNVMYGVSIGFDSTDTTTNQNKISQNSIFGNTGPGINLYYLSANPMGINSGTNTGPNNQAQIPTLSSVSIGNVTQATGTASPNSIVEVFLAQATQGRTYLGTGVANAAGNFNFIASLPAGLVLPASPTFVATDTLNDPAFPTRVGSTSQFSAPFTTATSSYVYNLPLLANNASTAVGQTTTFVTFQNLSSTNTATVNLKYYGIADGGLSPYQDTVTISIRGQRAILPAIPAGSSYGGIVTSNQPLNLVVSEALNAGGSAYNVSSTVAPTLYSPLALNGQYGFVTSIVVFNAGNAGNATGTIQFFDETGNPSGVTQNLNIPAHASQTFKQSDAGSGLSGSHAYWAKINGAAGSNLAAQVIEFGPANFVATFNAIGPAQVQNTLYAPATFNGQFNFVTGMAIANPNSGAATTNIKYYDAAGTLLLTQPFTIPANGVVGVFQPNVSGLPGTVSSATINSNQPLISTINEHGPGTISGTYVGLAGASKNVALPVMAKGFASFVTGATVLNTGSSPAHLNLTYYDQNGSPIGVVQTPTIAPNASFLVFQGDASQGLPDGFFGTALLTSDQPLLVTTNALQTGTGLFYTYTEPSS